MDLSSISTEALEAELERRRAAGLKQADMDRVEKIRALNINGITTKDVCVFFSDSPYDDGVKRYSFCFFHDGAVYDFYYDWMDWDSEPEKPLDWWPASQEQKFGGMRWSNDALEFVPPGFEEMSENCYHFDGTHEEALALLQSIGVKEIRDLDEEDRDLDEEEGYYD